MTTPVEAATDLYAQLKPEAIVQARSYVMSRTPADLQLEMADIIEADLADVGTPELPSDQAIVTNGAQVAVINDSGFPVPGEPGTANVAGGTFNGVQLGPVALGGGR